MNIHITNSATKFALLLALCASFAGCGTGTDNQLGMAVGADTAKSVTLDVGSDVRPPAASQRLEYVGIDEPKPLPSLRVETSGDLQYIVVIDEPKPYPLPCGVGIRTDVPKLVCGGHIYIHQPLLITNSRTGHVDDSMLTDQSVAN